MGLRILKIVFFYIYLIFKKNNNKTIVYRKWKLTVLKVVCPSSFSKIIVQLPFG